MTGEEWGLILSSKYKHTPFPAVPFFQSSAQRYILVSPKLLMSSVQSRRAFISLFYLIETFLNTHFIHSFESTTIRFNSNTNIFVDCFWFLVGAVCVSGVVENKNVKFWWQNQRVVYSVRGTEIWRDKKEKERRNNLHKNVILFFAIFLIKFFIFHTSDICSG